MPFENPSDDDIRKLLNGSLTIAIVGASSNPDRPSYGIAEQLQRAGYKIIPINPREQEILGEKAFPSLAAAPKPIDIVDVFRRAEDTPPIADEAADAGAKAIWLQSGISNEDTASRAAKRGLAVVMDACLGVAVRVLGAKPRNG